MHAPSLASAPVDNAMESLRKLVAVYVPEIGIPIIFGKRPQVRSKKWRTMQTAELLRPSPFPTLVIPLVGGSYSSHAFCVIDDLIFDTTLNCALPLTHEAITTLFNHDTWEVCLAYRFNRPL